MRTHPISFILLLICATLSAQNIKEIGPSNGLSKADVHFEGVNPENGACVPPALRSEMMQELKDQVKSLSKAGKLLSERGMLKSVQGLEWPLRSNNYDECGYFSVFQYFDHDESYGSVQDWNCGTITYDVPGYNHAGTDYGITPFAWNMMNDNSVEVIAAAGGQILQKQDGNFDMECNASNTSWNYLIIQHADGTFTMYGHMKSGSLTSLNVGDQINTGDYIGLVGSSGASTGPHLHFEVLDENYQSMDPYAGPCNNQGNGSMWANQHDYHEKGINRVMTHSAPPDSNSCPSLETINEQTYFQAGSQLYLGGYLRHAVAGDTYTVSLLRPDGSTYWSTNHSPSSFYASYMFYYSMYIPHFEQEGEWSLTLQADYGDFCSSVFTVGDCPMDLDLYQPVPSSVGVVKEEAANSISSTAVINMNADVTYDAGDLIHLNPGFEVIEGASFKAYIDGCGGQ